MTISTRSIHNDLSRFLPDLLRLYHLKHIRCYVDTQTSYNLFLQVYLLCLVLLNIFSKVLFEQEAHNLCFQGKSVRNNNLIIFSLNFFFRVVCEIPLLFCQVPKYFKKKLTSAMYYFFVCHFALHGRQLLVYFLMSVAPIGNLYFAFCKKRATGWQWKNFDALTWKNIESVPLH